MRELREGKKPDFIKQLDEKLDMERVDTAQWNADLMIEGPSQFIPAEDREPTQTIVERED